MSERSELDYNENIMFDGILTRIVGKANIIIEDPRELNILERLAKTNRTASSNTASPSKATC